MTIQKFVESRNQQVCNRHFYECEATNRPYVVIHPGRKYADVELDLIGTDYDLTNDAVEKVKQRFLAVWARKRQAFFCMGHTYCAVAVPLSEARSLAEWLYDLAISDDNHVSGDARYQQAYENLEQARENLGYK